MTNIHVSLEVFTIDTYVDLLSWYAIEIRPVRVFVCTHIPNASSGQFVFSSINKV